MKQVVGGSKGYSRLEPRVVLSLKHWSMRQVATTTQLWPLFGATIHVSAKPHRSFWPLCSHPVHCFRAHVRPYCGIYLLLGGPKPRISPAHAIKLGAPVPYVSRKCHPGHVHEISEVKNQIPRDYAVSKQPI